jgi:hypoxanthine phosphoribosyltransferase
VLLDPDQIQQRLTEIGEEITRDYAGHPPLVVGVLKGAVMVVADLTRRIDLDIDMDWMAVSSYGAGTKSSGVVRILKDLGTDIHDRDVLIVEDIIDSGLTLKWLTENLRSRGPRSVEICTLLRKPEALKVDIDVRYVGFDVPGEFVIGYGLDHAETYRNLPYVGILKSSVYKD